MSCTEFGKIRDCGGPIRLVRLSVYPASGLLAMGVSVPAQAEPQLDQPSSGAFRHLARERAAWPVVAVS